MTLILLISLVLLSFASLFVGVIDLDLPSLLFGHAEQLRILLVSRLPRLLAVLCTGVGMSVAGLIMQQLCMNKFVSPTTGATISSAQLGILLALLFMLACDVIGRIVIAPYELPIELIIGILGSLLFIALLLYRLRHGRKAISLRALFARKEGYAP